MSETVGFYDEKTEGESLGFHLSPEKGTTAYRFKVWAAQIGYWDDGRPRLDIKPQVASGEYKDMFGPTLTVSIGESSGTTSSGREFTITEEDAQKRLRVTVKNIHTGKPQLRLTNPSSYDTKMLEEIAAQITGDEFIATVRRDGDYDRVARVYSLAEPPKSYIDADKASAFTV